MNRRQNGHLCDRASGTLSCASAPQARRTRPVRDPCACVRGHELHRRALELQRSAVRGSLSLRSSVHPSATLECEHRRRPVMAAIGLRASAPSWRCSPCCSALPQRQPGTAPTCRPTRSHTAQPDRNLLTVCGRGPLSAADGPPLGGYHAALLGGGVQQSMSSRRPPCAYRGVPVVPPSHMRRDRGRVQRRVQ